jgi:hypothetical protein
MAFPDPRWSGSDGAAYHARPFQVRAKPGIGPGEKDSYGVRH